VTGINQSASDSFPLIMNEVCIQYLDTPFGQLILGALGDMLCLCDWRYRKMRKTIDRRIKGGLDATYAEAETELVRRTADQLGEYFRGNRTEFDLPLLPVGTPFQKKVWEELSRIPYGLTLSYTELTNKISKPPSIRAVAAASGANALSLLIPCHRVTGSRGELRGYAGGLMVKKRLLEMEAEKAGAGQLRLFSESTQY
jgi:methylated-DNA-[protein]-cysteine S-methyltransferase